MGKLVTSLFLKRSSTVMAFVYYLSFIVVLLGSVTGANGASSRRTCLYIKNVERLSSSGQYTVNELSGSSKDVYCDMDTQGGGWTLMFKAQQGFNISVNYTDPADVEAKLMPNNDMFASLFKNQLWIDGTATTPLTPLANYTNGNLTTINGVNLTAINGTNTTQSNYTCSDFSNCTTPYNPFYSLESLAWSQYLEKGMTYNLRQTCSKFYNESDKFDFMWRFVYPNMTSQATDTSAANTTHWYWSLLNHTVLHDAISSKYGITWDSPSAERVFWLPIRDRGNTTDPTDVGQVYCGDGLYNYTECVSNTTYYRKLGNAGVGGSGTKLGATYLPYGAGPDVAYIDGLPHVYGRSQDPMVCSYYLREMPPASCAEIQKTAGGTLPSGKYLLKLPSSDYPVESYCDFTTEGGGWTLMAKFQQASNASSIPQSAYDQYFGDDRIWIEGDSQAIPTSPLPESNVNYTVQSHAWSDFLTVGQAYQLRQTCGKDTNLNTPFDFMYSFVYDGYTSQVDNGRLSLSGWKLYNRKVLTDVPGITWNYTKGISQELFVLPFKNGHTGDKLSPCNGYAWESTGCDAATADKRRYGNAGIVSVANAGYGDPGGASWLPNTNILDNGDPFDIASFSQGVFIPSSCSQAIDTCSNVTTCDNTTNTFPVMGLNCTNNFTGAPCAQGSQNCTLCNVTQIGTFSNITQNCTTVPVCTYKTVCTNSTTFPPYSSYGRTNDMMTCSYYIRPHPDVNGTASALPKSCQEILETNLENSTTHHYLIQPSMSPQPVRAYCEFNLTLALQQPTFDVGLAEAWMIAVKLSYPGTSVYTLKWRNRDEAWYNQYFRFNTFMEGHSERTPTAVEPEYERYHIESHNLTYFMSEGKFYQWRFRTYKDDYNTRLDEVDFHDTLQFNGRFTQGPGLRLGNKMWVLHNRTMITNKPGLALENEFPEAPYLWFPPVLEGGELYNGKYPAMRQFDGTDAFRWDDYRDELPYNGITPVNDGCLGTAGYSGKVAFTFPFTRTGITRSPVTIRADTATYGTHPEHTVGYYYLRELSTVDVNAMPKTCQEAYERDPSLNSRLTYLNRDQEVVPTWCEQKDPLAGSGWALLTMHFSLTKVVANQAKEMMYGQFPGDPTTGPIPSGKVFNEGELFDKPYWAQHWKTWIDNQRAGDYMVFSHDWRKFLTTGRDYEMRLKCYRDGLNQKLHTQYLFNYPGFVQQQFTNTSSVLDKAWVILKAKNLDTNMGWSMFEKEAFVPEELSLFYLPWANKTTQEYVDGKGILCHNPTHGTILSADGSDCIGTCDNHQNMGFVRYGGLSPNASIGTQGPETLIRFAEETCGGGAFSSVYIAQYSSEWGTSNTDMQCNMYFRESQENTTATSCADFAGQPSGTYLIRSHANPPRTQLVYCDMDTDGGGWVLAAKFAKPRNYTISDTEYEHLFGKQAWTTGTPQGAPQSNKTDYSTHIAQSAVWGDMLKKGEFYELRQKCFKFSNESNLFDHSYTFIYNGHSQQNSDGKLSHKSWKLSNRRDLLQSVFLAGLNLTGNATLDAGKNSTYLDSSGIQWDTRTAETYRFILPFSSQVTAPRYLLPCNGYEYSTNPTSCGTRPYGSSGIVGDQPDNKDPSASVPYQFGLSGSIDLAYVHQAPHIYGNSGDEMTCHYYIRPLPDQYKTFPKSCFDLKFNASADPNNPNKTIEWPSGTYIVQDTSLANTTAVPQQVYCDMDTEKGGWTLMSRFTQPNSVTNLPADTYNAYFRDGSWFYGVSDGTPDVQDIYYADFQVESVDWRSIMGTEGNVIWEMRQSCGKGAGAATDKFDRFMEITFPGFYEQALSRVIGTNCTGPNGTCYDSAVVPDLDPSKKGWDAAYGWNIRDDANVFGGGSAVGRFWLPYGGDVSGPVICGDQLDATGALCDSVTERTLRNAGLGAVTPGGSDIGAAMLPFTRNGTGADIANVRSSAVYGATGSPMTCTYHVRQLGPAPYVSSATSVGTVGGTITITGGNFGVNSRPVVIDVARGSIACAGASWLSDTQVKCNVVPGFGEHYDVAVQIGSQKSREYPIFSYQEPTIYGYRPKVYSVGTEMTITGANFGLVTAPISGSIDNIPCTGNTWLDTNHITCTLGVGVTTGHTIFVAIGNSNTTVKMSRHNVVNPSSVALSPVWVPARIDTKALQISSGLNADCTNLYFTNDNEVLPITRMPYAIDPLTPCGNESSLVYIKMPSLAAVRSSCYSIVVGDVPENVPSDEPNLIYHAHQGFDLPNAANATDGTGGYFGTGGNQTSCTISDKLVLAGSHSLRCGGIAATDFNYTHPNVTLHPFNDTLIIPFTPVGSAHITEFAMYDHHDATYWNSTLQYRDFLNDSQQAEIVQEAWVSESLSGYPRIGFYSHAPEVYSYAFGDTGGDSGQGWIKTSIRRQRGWNRISFVHDVANNVLEFKVNDIIIYSATLATPAAYAFVMGHTENVPFEVFFDEVRSIPYQSQVLEQSSCISDTCHSLKLQNPGDPSGPYNVRYPNAIAASTLYCDQDTDSGGWLLMSEFSTTGIWKFINNNTWDKAVYTTPDKSWTKDGGDWSGATVFPVSLDITTNGFRSYKWPEALIEGQDYDLRQRCNKKGTPIYIDGMDTMYSFTYNGKVDQGNGTKLFEKVWVLGNYTVLQNYSAAVDAGGLGANQTMFFALPTVYNGQEQVIGCGPDGYTYSLNPCGHTTNRRQGIAGITGNYGFNVMPNIIRPTSSGNVDPAYMEGVPQSWGESGDSMGCQYLIRPRLHPVPTSCSDIAENWGYKERNATARSGQYLVRRPGATTSEVIYCDFHTVGRSNTTGSWTLLAQFSQPGGGDMPAQLYNDYFLNDLWIDGVAEGPPLNPNPVYDRHHVYSLKWEDWLVKDEFYELRQQCFVGANDDVGVDQSFVFRYPGFTKQKDGSVIDDKSWVLSSRYTIQNRYMNSTTYNASFPNAHATRFWLPFTPNTQGDILCGTNFSRPLCTGRSRPYGNAGIVYEGVYTEPFYTQNIGFNFAPSTATGYDVAQLTSAEAPNYEFGTSDYPMACNYYIQKANVSDAPSSCSEIKRKDPTATSGVYLVYPVGGSVSDPSPVYCDMDTESGGWTLMAKFSQNNTAGLWEEVLAQHGHWIKGNSQARPTNPTGRVDSDYELQSLHWGAHLIKDRAYRLRQTCQQHEPGNLGNVSRAVDIMASFIYPGFVTQQPGIDIHRKGWYLANFTDLTDDTSVEWHRPGEDIRMFWLPFGNQSDFSTSPVLCGKDGFTFDDTNCGGEPVGYNAGIIGASADRRDPAFSFLPNSLRNTSDLALIHQGAQKKPYIDPILSMAPNFTWPIIPDDHPEMYFYGRSELPMTCSYYIQDIETMQIPINDNCDIYLQADSTLTSGLYIVQPQQYAGKAAVSPKIVYCDQDAEGGGWALLSKFSQNDTIQNLPTWMKNDYFTNNMWIDGYAQTVPMTPVPSYDGYRVESWDWNIFLQNLTSYQLRQHCMVANGTDEWDVIFSFDYEGFVNIQGYDNGGTDPRDQGIALIDYKTSKASGNVPLDSTGQLAYMHFPRRPGDPNPIARQYVLSGCAGGRWSNSSDATNLHCGELFINGNTTTWFNYSLNVYGMAGFVGVGSDLLDETDGDMDLTSPGAAFLPNLLPGTTDWAYIPQARKVYGLSMTNVNNTYDPSLARDMVCYYWARINKAPPKVASVTNSTTAGSLIIISGANFGATSRPVIVEFVFTNGNNTGKVPCGSPNWLSSSTISCLAPQGMGFGHSIVVEVDGRNNTANDLFSYQQPTPISATRVPTAGGTITIRGTNFGEIPNPVTTTVDQVPCINALWVSNSIITCDLGPGIGGGKDVEVIVAGSWSDPNTLFSYEGPVVTAISTANTWEETVVTLYGQNFGEADNAVNTLFYVGASIYQCIDPVWVSSTRLTCRAPPKLPSFGTTSLSNLQMRVDIGGQIVPYHLLDYRGRVIPSFQSNPAVGIIWDDLHDDKGFISFDLTDAVPVAVNLVFTGGDLSIFTTPPYVEIELDSTVTPAELKGTLKYKPSGINGTSTWDVQVDFNSYGKIYNSSMFSLTINVNPFPPPVIDKVIPDRGPSCTSIDLNVRGNYFGKEKANFTNAWVSNLPCKEDRNLYRSVTVLNCKTAGTEEKRLVSGPMRVQTTDGITDGAYFTVIDAQVFNVTPSAGPAVRPTELTITGKYFGEAAFELQKISIADVPCKTSTWVSSTRVKCVTAPSGGPKTGPVFIETTGSTCLGPSQQFEYQAPTITALDPIWSHVRGNDSITIRGRYFGDGVQNNVTSVKFAGAECLEFTHISDSLIHCITANVTGPRYQPVYVTSEWGGEGVSSTKYNYYWSLFEKDKIDPFPELHAAQPDHGPTTGDTIITLTGLFLGKNNTDIDRIYIGADKVPCWHDHQTLYDTPWGVAPANTTSGNGTLRIMQKSSTQEYPVLKVPYNGTDIFQPNPWWYNSTMVRCITYAGRGGVYRDYPKVQTRSPVVVVTHSGGTALRSQALFTFEYPNPRISGISPKLVPYEGNVNITIHGDFFGYKPDPWDSENQGLVIMMGGYHCLHSYFHTETTAICTVHSKQAMDDGGTGHLRFQAMDYRLRKSQEKELGLEYVDRLDVCPTPCGVHANCINRECICQWNYGKPPDCAIRAVTAMPNEFLREVRYYANPPVVGVVQKPAYLSKYEPSNYEPSDFPPYIVSESGDRSTEIAVWLNREPVVPVTIVPYSNDTTEVIPDAQMIFREGEKSCQGEVPTFDPTLMTKSCIKVFTVTGREDTLRDGDVNVEIRFLVKSKDPHFNNMYVPPVVLTVLESNPVIEKLSPGMSPTYGANLTLRARNMDPKFTVKIGQDQARYWYSWDVLGNNMTFDGLTLGSEFVAFAEPPPPLVTKNRRRSQVSQLQMLQAVVPNVTGPQDNASIVEGNVLIVIETPTVAGSGYRELTLLNEGGSSRKIADLLFFSNDCPEEGYWGTGKDCRLCPIGGICPGGKRLRPKYGYWNYNESNPWVYKCIPAKRCAGCDNTSLASECYVPDPHAGGKVYAPCGHTYMDEYCAHCIEGYEEMHGVCVECPSYQKFILLLVGVILLWVSVAFTGWFVPSHETFSHWILVILACQEIGGVSQMLLDDMPLTVKRVYGFFAMFNGQLSFLSPDCFHGRFDYEADFGWAVLFNAVLGIPLLIGIPIVKFYSMYKHRNDELEISDAFRNFYNDRFVRSVTCVISLLYFPLTQKCVETISCLPVNGEWRLATDVSHVCYSLEHMMAYGAAVVLLLSLTIGWPTLYYLWIRRNREFLYYDQQFMNRFDFLYGQFLAKYRSGWMAEFFIRASIAAGATVLRNYNLLQYAVVGGAFFFQVCLVIFLMPYRRRWTNFVRMGLALSNFMAVTIILMVRLGKVDASSSQPMAFSMLGLAGISLLLLLTAGLYWTIKAANEVNINVLMDQADKARIAREKAEEDELEDLLDDVFVMPKFTKEQGGTGPEAEQDLDILDTVARPFVAAAEYVGEANIPDPLIALGLEEAEAPTYYYETRPGARRIGMNQEQADDASINSIASVGSLPPLAPADDATTTTL
eukprot:TRINITY_DN2784_c0_g1_i1.p1 TRINITY_DN2784_c0_g1~~TRINITY_DN2784_c0_g1_i1.p1  ORF type:complete len:5518 (+),score=923.76 TRINITY_DN2784_c0_g1_i1:209-16762(+)